MANTYTLIASNTLSSSASSVTFSSIAATYTDLIIKASARCSTTDHGVNVSFNGAATYDRINIYGNGSSAGSDVVADLLVYGGMNNSSYTANTFSNFEMYAPNYTSSSYKSMSIDTTTENNATANNFTAMVAGLRSVTSAITSITLTPETGSFVQYSTFYLYGIKNS